MNPYAEAVGALFGWFLVAFFGVLVGLHTIHPGLAFFFLFWMGLLCVGISASLRFRERGMKNAALWFGVQLSMFSGLIAIFAYRVAGTKGLFIAAMQIADMVDYAIVVAVVVYLVAMRRSATDQPAPVRELP